MGDGADELIFHLFRLFEALGHPVDGATQAVHLIPLVAGDGQTNVQLTPGDAGGGALHLSQRHHDAPHEVQARHDGKGQHRRTHDEGHHHGAFELFFHQRQTGDETHGSHIFGCIGYETAGRHDHLSALGAVDGDALPVHSVLRLLKVGVGDDALGIGAAGRGNDTAVAVQQHELIFVLIGELLHHPAQSHAAAGGGLLARFAGVHFELAGDGRKAAVHGLLDAVVVAAGGAVEEHDLHQQHQQYRNEQTAPQPSPGDTASHSVFSFPVNFTLPSPRPRRIATPNRRNEKKVQQRRPPPAADTGRSCWGRGQQDASGSEADAGSRNPS